MNDFRPRFMDEAFELAACGLNRVHPNPRVGAVVVRNGRVVGRGWHVCCGGPHAEVNALARAGRRAKGADLYVTLEPCSTRGRTPPCTEAILASGVSRVFVGAVDADPRNRHRARRVLGRYGIPVFLMDYRERHRALNRVFLFHQENRIPYVQLKAGQTLDGALSDRFGKSKWITGERAREAGRLLRMHADSVLVGADTLNRDDPALDVRMPPSPGWRDPARVILSGSGELNVGARLLRRESSSPVWVLTSREGARRLDGRIRNPRCRVAAFRSGRNNRIPLKRCLTYLKQRGYHNLLVEGGADLLTGFLKTRLFNELHLFVAPRIFGGGSLRPGGNEPLAGVRSRDALQLLETRQYENDVYLRYLNVYRHH